MPDIKDALDALFARHKQRTARSLALNAQRSYAEGERYALMRMGGGFDWQREEPTSWLYAQEYRRLLEEEGATIINGEKNYWFRDSSEQAKQDVLKIIEDGIAAGKPLGIKERKRGGYAKGTIAADLNPYFSSMRSHASMVARTEVGRVQNLGSCLTYLRYDIDEFLVLDDEGPNSCAECGVANMQIWPAEYALAHELEHPNCFIDPHVQIFTADGWRGIGSIGVGDLVLTHMGRFRRVIDLIRSTTTSPPSMVTIDVATPTEQHKLTVTEDHPVMLNGAWRPAKEAVIGGTVGMMATLCAACGTQVPWWRTYCSNACHGRAEMMALRADPAWLSKSRTAQQIKMRELLSDPVRLSAQTAAAHAKTREMVQAGVHPFQRPETHLKACRTLASMKYATLLEKRMAWLLEQKGIAFERNRPIQREEMVGKRHRFYLPDFTLIAHKVIIECDGEKWHDATSAMERERNDYLASLGYTVLHFSGAQITDDLAACSLSIDRVLANHAHEYEFMAAPILAVKRWTAVANKRLYNLSVEEDESYIAKGFVVHNCVRRFAPHVKLPKGLDEDVARYRAENPLPSPDSLPWRDWRASKRMAAADAWLLNARRMPMVIEVW